MTGGHGGGGPEGDQILKILSRVYKAAALGDATKLCLRLGVVAQGPAAAGQELGIQGLGLGEPAQAEADFERFQRAFAAAQPALLARLVLAFARHDLDAEAWGDAHARLHRHQPRLDAAASIEARIELHALLARALRALARPAEAAREQGLVVALARRPAARALAAPAREALAEVRFALAEEKRLAAEQLACLPLGLLAPGLEPLLALRVRLANGPAERAGAPRARPVIDDTEIIEPGRDPAVPRDGYVLRIASTLGRLGLQSSGPQHADVAEPAAVDPEIGLPPRYLGQF